MPFLLSLQHKTHTRPICNAYERDHAAFPRCKPTTQDKLIQKPPPVHMPIAAWRSACTKIDVLDVYPLRATNSTISRMGTADKPSAPPTRWEFFPSPQGNSSRDRCTIAATNCDRCSDCAAVPSRRTAHMYYATHTHTHMKKTRTQVTTKPMKVHPRQQTHAIP